MTLETIFAISSSSPAGVLGRLCAIHSLLFAAIFPVLFTTGCGGVVSAAVNPQPIVDSMLATEEKAWNANDNATYASLYTVDADFVNIRGQVFTGSVAIAKLHGQIFAGPFKGSTIKITTRLFKALAPGLVQVDTDQEVTGYASLPPGIVPTAEGVLLTHFKYLVALQEDGSWKFVSGQNTSALPNIPLAGPSQAKAIAATSY